MRTKAEQPNAKRTQSSAERALRVLDVLKGHSLTGLTNKQITEATGYFSSGVSLSLNTLAAAGFVTQLETGRWAHSIKFLQMAQAHADHISRMQGRINEYNARVIAGAHQ
ncbi:helix-turn-helix domain-containing protein [Thiothrix lacustris]|uniref:helix-turn-helix domain-containing protein n=1 Tax=Thiothrix lacustris TaxID=525917 RepID=UPI00048E952C|nr:helix-turn-helix domain-containing protein [Thiothrix lacustris]